MCFCFALEKFSPLFWISRCMFVLRFLFLSIPISLAQLYLSTTPPHFDIVFCLISSPRPSPTSQGSPVHHCSFCPNDPTLVVVSGNGVLKFFRVDAQVKFILPLGAMTHQHVSTIMLSLTNNPKQSHMTVKTASLIAFIFINSPSSTAPPTCWNPSIRTRTLSRAASSNQWPFHWANANCNTTRVTRGSRSAC
jgi:hypothetical protein